MRKLTSGAYAFTNILNGHRYIGSSKDIVGRKNNHIHRLRNNKHHAIYFQRAWNLYGENNFSFEILNNLEPYDRTRKMDKAYIKSFKSALIAMEQYYFDTLKPEYNSCPTAGSPLGFEHTPVTKEKLRQAKLGKPNSDESKVKNSVASQAMWDAHPEYREIASQRQSDIMTPERREQMRDLRLGRPLAEVFGEERAREITEKIQRNTDHVARGKAISIAKMGKPRPDMKGKAGPSSVSGEWGVIFRTDTQRFSVQIEGIRYGSFLTKEEAVARRDFVDAALKTNSPIPKAIKTNKGKPRPEDVRRKISAAQKGRPKRKAMIG